MKQREDWRQSRCEIKSDLETSWGFFVLAECQLRWEELQEEGRWPASRRRCQVKSLRTRIVQRLKITCRPVLCLHRSLNEIKSDVSSSVAPGGVCSGCSAYGRAIRCHNGDEALFGTKQKKTPLILLVLCVFVCALKCL